VARDPGDSDVHSHAEAREGEPPMIAAIYAPKSTDQQHIADEECV
jgi:hypothetical protein